MDQGHESLFTARVRVRVRIHVTLGVYATSGSLDDMYRVWGGNLEGRSKSMAGKFIIGNLENRCSDSET